MGWDHEETYTTCNYCNTYYLSYEGKSHDSFMYSTGTSYDCPTCTEGQKYMWHVRNIEHDKKLLEELILNKDKIDLQYELAKKQIKILEPEIKELKSKVSEAKQLIFEKWEIPKEFITVDPHRKASFKFISHYERKTDFDLKKVCRYLKSKDLYKGTIKDFVTLHKGKSGIKVFLEYIPRFTFINILGSLNYDYKHNEQLNEHYSTHKDIKVYKELTDTLEELSKQHSKFIHVSSFEEQHIFLKNRIAEVQQKMDSDINGKELYFKHIYKSDNE